MKAYRDQVAEEAKTVIIASNAMQAKANTEYATARARKAVARAEIEEIRAVIAKMELALYRARNAEELRSSAFGEEVN